MNTIKNKLKGKITYCLLAAGILFTSCDKNFDEINTNPNGADPSTASLDAVMATVQIYAFGEPRFITWRGNVIYSSRFAHHFIYNFGDMAWFPGAAYTNNPGWTGNVWESSYIKVGGHINALRSLADSPDEANEMAVTNIMAAWFYQKMTDIYGDVPYSDVARPQTEVELLPGFDDQATIYRSVIESLKEQMNALDGAGTLGFGGGDFIFESDPEKWIAFANTLRLRMAIRSRNAFISDGEQSFIDGVITDALNNPLIDESNQPIFLRAQSGLFLSDPNELMGGPEDVWWSFQFNQTRWTLNERVVALMRDNNDPRLTILATETDSIPGMYVGTEPNLTAPPLWGFLSKPSEALRGAEKNDPVPSHPLMAHESYFLQAEAALLGIGSGSADDLFKRGIRAHMDLYDVDPADIDDFVQNEQVAQLNGTVDENLNKVWNQRWLALLNNGYEAWSLVRRTDMIPDQVGDEYLTNSTNGEVPSRLPYPTSENTLNAQNVLTAVTRQGTDVMTTKIWWDVN